MLALNRIHLPTDRIAPVPLVALGPSHRLSDGLTKTYQRFFALESVARHPDDLMTMLGAALDGALAGLDAAEYAKGHLVYCKTQTHGGLSDQNWLRRLADGRGLQRWETYSISMTSCASALVQMHFAHMVEAAEPVVILTGEKAFHPSVARLPVGLLGEIPAAALFNAGPGRWNVLATQVRHLPRFYQNPDAMDLPDRRALQDCYLNALVAFVTDSLAAYAALLRDDFLFLPHNLNLPVTHALLRHFAWSDRTYHGPLAQMGHAYCSDIFVNVEDFEQAQDAEVAPGTQLLVLAAGTGVTFATCLLERTTLA